MRILGLDLGSWSIKAVEVESRFRRLDILDFHEVRLPLQRTNTTEAYHDGIVQLLGRLPVHPDKIVTALPSTQTVVRFLNLPVKSRKKVEQMYRFELEDIIPFKLDDSILEHQVMKSNDGNLVCVCLAPKKHIVGYIDFLKTLSLDPDWLTFDGMGLINMFLSQAPDAQALSGTDIASMLLDVGHSKTNLSIFREGRLEFFRSLSWGGAAITEALAIAMGSTLEEAETYKSTELTLSEQAEQISEESQELARAALQSIQPLTADLSHSMVAYRNTYKKEISQIVMSGGTSRLNGLPEYLSRALRLPARTMHGMSKIKLKEELRFIDDLRFTEVVGRSFVFDRKVTFLFNFRQQEVAKETSLTEVTSFLSDNNVRLLAKFVGVLFVILFCYVFVGQYIVSQESTASKDDLKKVFGQVFPNINQREKNALLKNPADLKKFLDRKNAELDQKIKVLSKKRVPMLNLVNAISAAFPPDVKVDVNMLQLSDQKMQLEGVLYTGDLEKVTEALKRLSFLNKVEGTRDGQRFTYTAELIGR